MATELNENYAVAQDTVTLTVDIGQGQMGNSRVRIDGTLIAAGEDIENVEIGKAPDLIGKTLTVKTTVSDLNDQTNLTSVTYHLNHGVEDKKYTLEEPAAKDGDKVTYRATFTFSQG